MASLILAFLSGFILGAATLIILLLQGNKRHNQRREQQAQAFEHVMRIAGTANTQDKPISPVRIVRND